MRRSVLVVDVTEQHHLITEDLMGEVGKATVIFDGRIRAREQIEVEPRQDAERRPWPGTGIDIGARRRKTVRARWRSSKEHTRRIGRITRELPALKIRDKPWGRSAAGRNDLIVLELEVI